MTAALWLVLGAAVGAPLRYVVDLLVSSRHDSVFPWGTFTVNVSGSFVLGLVTGVLAAGGDPASLRYGVGLGLAGAFTTFSTFAYETVRLLADGALGAAAANVVASTVVAVVAAALGFGLAAVLVP